MKFRKRLAVLEKSFHRLYYVPLIVLYSIVEPGEDDPKEVEAFAEMQTNAVCHTIDRKPMKLRSSLKGAFITSSISKKHSAKVQIRQRQLPNVAVYHVLRVRAITTTV